MISPIRYEVEIHEPLSTPVPMPPSMLSSEALVIWMLRIAMNEPIMAATTAIQVVTLARSGSAIMNLGSSREIGSGTDNAWLDMTRPQKTLFDVLDAAIAWRCSACDLVSMVGITDMPGRNSIAVLLSASS